MGLESDFDEMLKKVVEFISSGVESTQKNGAVIGLSGGIDSTLTAFLSVKAIGKENVLGILLPERGVTDPEDICDAMQVTEILGIKHKVIEISELLDAFASAIPDYDPASQICNGNLKARVRMCTLYYYANLLNRLVIGTGNKTEILLGYTTKYGDGGVDMLPLGGLYKTRVIALARHLKVPKQIIEKPPSAGLWKGQTDEKELGISYEMIDSILMKLIDEKKAPTDIKRELNISEDIIERIIGRIKENRHKREMPPIPEM